MDDFRSASISGIRRASTNVFLLVLNMFIDTQQMIEASKKDVTKILQGMINNDGRFDRKNSSKFF